MKKGKIFKNLHMLCIIFLIFMVVGCGSNNDSVNDEGGIAFQGTVTAPLGAIAHLKGREGIFRKVFPCAFAGVTGLEAVPGASVELIEVDENGNQVGDVLASTITSTTGHYILKLPVGFVFSAKLVVRVTGTNAVTMRAQVVYEVVDIDPISEYIFQTLTTDGNTLDNIAANEVLRLRGYVEEFDFLAAADIDATLEAINTTVADDLDEIIAEIQQPDGDAADIAGEYFIHDMSMQIATWPGNLAFLDLGEIRIQKTNGGDAAITNAHYNDNQMVLEALMDPQQNVTYTLRVEYDDEYSDQSVNLHLDNEGTVTVFWPMEESIYCDGNVGMRWDARTEYFYPFSYDENNGVYVTSFIETGTQYSLNAEETALDLSKPIGSLVNYCFGFLSQKAPVTNDALDNNIYGCVGFGQQYENNGDRKIFSGMGTLTLSSTDDTTGIVKGDINLMALNREILPNYPNVALSWNVVNGENVDDPIGKNEQFTNNYEYELNITTGELAISDGDDQFEGYVGNGGDVILIPQFQTTRNEETVVDAQLELLCGVRLSSSGNNPDILGKSYRVFWLEGGFGETGRNEIICMEDGNATINDGTTITFSATEIYAWKTDDFKVDNFTSDTEAIEWEIATYTFSGTNGAITITEGDGLTMKGYMNYNGSIAVFRVYESNLAQERYATLGIFVLVEKVESSE